MKLRTFLFTAIWLGAMILSWQAGAWKQEGEEYSAEQPIHLLPGFHMHKPLHEGGKVGMAGQFHIEIVSNANGVHQIWLSNAYRQEMDPSGFEGMLVIEPINGKRQELSFQRESRLGKVLIAKSEPIKGQAWLTVNATLGELAQFKAMKFFWNYDQKQIAIKIPEGLDSMLPMPFDNILTDKKAALGHELFFDPLLSADKKVSCATCHRPEFAFAEPVAISKGIAGRKGKRNAPTILNSAYSVSLFWDGRSESLEEQAMQPILNHAEMGFEDQTAFLAQLKPKYNDKFQEVFGKDISLKNIARAIANYERTLLSGDSNFDRFEAGKRDAISEAAQRGRTLFFGKAKCGSCHIPPLFTDFKFHNLGIGWQGKNKGDLGRFEITTKQEDIGAFRTPTLRDISRTAPYMHDGSISSLRQVIQLYNSGGNPNPALDRTIQLLDLSEKEIDDLLAFLQTLDGRIVDFQKQDSSQNIEDNE